MKTSSPGPHRRRSDAQLNRERILDAGREVMADRGAEASMAEVARRADVGMATLYRNFPGRRELLEALFTNEVDELCRAVQAPSGTPVDALFTWLRLFAAFHHNKHPIALELLRHTTASDSVFGDSRERVLAAGRPLLLAAQQAREIRTDLTLDQVLDLTLAIVTIPGERDYVEPIFQASLDGLRTPPAESSAK
ncbi:TetR family transcriptional regulator [Subtercola boreus]|uniref:TetR family transcriptional regulator n=1 Tax=Subtercola boreus TaxID=120213 RepID=A0A3E0VQ25_9MICO|nr:TetR/AcrR family transcriptional regulator [Subtercola boreus]RFA11719.1 TetR family transcriptional regulator [Subtercola boreus]